MDRREFIGGLLAGAAVIPAAAALPAAPQVIYSNRTIRTAEDLEALRAHRRALDKVNWRYLMRVANVECDNFVDEYNGIIRCYEPTNYIDPRQRGA